jgi:hypothetical protein
MKVKVAAAKAKTEKNAKRSKAGRMAKRGR